MKNFVQDGKVLTFTESELSHPTHTDSLVDSGDPVLVGRIPGVAAISAAAATDSISVALEGVFDLPATIAYGGLTKGETVYADPSTLVLSDNPAGVPFGTAVESLSSGTGTIDILLLGPTPGAVGAGS